MKRFLTKIKGAFTKPQLDKAKNRWGGISLIVLVIIIGILNHKTGTILTGWDNLHPEFDLGLNIKRSIFAVWQEYQSLGLLGGMGHASDLVRQILLFPITLVAPMESVRYIATIITLIIGSLGTYTLIRSYIAKNIAHKEFISFLGGAFYLLNIATIQTYFVAFEAFTSHYAALPWVLYGVLLFVHEKSKRSLVIFSLILLLATPAGYIPTLFVASLIAIGIILTTLILTSKTKVETLSRSIKAYVLIFLINSFWLLPFAYFTLTESAVNVDAKMNQMATDTIFAQNKEFGDITDVMQLKGFWFNSVDPNLNGDFTFMLNPWRQYFETPVVTIASFLIFGVILFGLFYAIKNRKPIHLAFTLLFLFAFTMLATNTAPFSWFVTLFREIPLFSQAFRFPFTKFSILVSLMYSVFFALGTYAISTIVRKYIHKLSLLPLILGVALIAITSYPVFKGNLFYEKEQITLPQEYMQTFEFFDAKDPTERIATLPLHTFWGWNYYEWGYGGSGFLWYGIDQPMVDRAFDVWSKSSENNYFELSQALYSKNPEDFLRVAEKYQITWFILDRNIYSTASSRALFYSETEDLFAQIPQISKEKTFGKIDIYKVNLKNKPQNFLISGPSLPSVNSYVHGNNDVFKDSDFYSDKSPYTRYFPFRSVFSGKSQGDLEFIIEQDDNYITLKNTLPQDLDATTLSIPTLLEEQFVASEFILEKDSEGTAIISVRILSPKVFIDSKPVMDYDTTAYPLFIIPQADSNYHLDINGHEITLQNDFQKEYALLSLEQKNFIYLTSENDSQTKIQIIEPDFLTSLPQMKDQQIKLDSSLSGKPFVIEIPKTIDSQKGFELDVRNFSNSKDCNTFRNGTTSSEKSDEGVVLRSLNDSLCTSYFLPSLSHEIGYLVDVAAENIEGFPLHFWILNSNQQVAVLDTYLEKDKKNFSYVIAPTDQFGKGYSVHFDSVSIGNNKTSNNLKGIKIYPLPYSFIENISIDAPFESGRNTLTFDSQHPNESLYVIENIKAENNLEATLILSQSYHAQWKAYSIDSNRLNLLSKIFPFFAGDELKSHVVVNNWENGWVINEPDSLSGKSIIIVFLPQYLEYLGFLILIILFAVMLLRSRIKDIARISTNLNSFFEVRSEILRQKVRDSKGEIKTVSFPYFIDLSDKSKLWQNQ